MKNKFLNFLFVLFLILPCSLIITACKNDPPPDTQPPEGSTGSLTMNIEPQNDFWLTNVNAQHYLDPGAEIIENETYAIWFADYYNKDTLQVLYDNEPLSTLTLLPTPGYEDKNIGINVRKIATFSLPQFNPGEHEVKILLKDEDLEIKFVSDEQSFTSDELEALSTFTLPLEDNIDFASIMDTDFTIKTSYIEITNGISDDIFGIPYNCSKRLGYYILPALFKPATMNPSLMVPVHFFDHTGGYDFAFTIDAFDSNFTFTNKTIELTFRKEGLNLSTLGLCGENEYSSIFTFVDGENEYQNAINPHYWAPTNANDIKVYLEPYAGVDFSNVEVYIYDTKMTLYEDAEKGNKKYFTIPAGKLPVDYCPNDKTRLSFHYFEINVENLDLSQSNLITNFNCTANNSSILTVADSQKYFVYNGIKYFTPNQQANVTISTEGNNVRPTSVIFNGTTFDLRDYVYENLSIPVGSSDSGLDAWRDENQSHYTYKLTIGSKPVYLAVSFNEDGTIQSITISFTLTGSTTAEFIF